MGIIKCSNRIIGTVLTVAVSSTTATLQEDDFELSESEPVLPDDTEIEEIEEGAPFGALGASLKRGFYTPKSNPKEWINPDQNKELIVNDQGDDFLKEEPVHVCLFSDRLAATPLVIQSVAEHASRPDLIHIWIVTPRESYPDFKHLKQSGIFKNGIHVHVTALEDITDELVTNGYNPVWAWPEYGSSLKDPEWLTMEHSTQPLKADVDQKHMHPMNHLRFYLPYIKRFQNARRLILLDDDVVLQGDLNDLVALPFPRDKVIITNCRRWKHHNGTFAYEIPFRGDAANVLLGRLDKATRKDVANHWKHMNMLASEIIGRNVSLHNETYFNFGVSLLNLEEWRRLDLTAIYHAWMKANYMQHIYREDTLAYGLGIPFCTFYGHVLCHHPKNRFQVLDGPGWLSWDKMQSSGWTEGAINNTFALHYNGRNKPWYMKPAKGFRKLHPFLHNKYLEYAQDLPFEMQSKLPAMREDIIGGSDHGGSGGRNKRMRQFKEAFIGGKSDSDYQKFLEEKKTTEEEQQSSSPSNRKNSMWHGDQFKKQKHNSNHGGSSISRDKRKSGHQKHATKAHQRNHRFWR